VLLDVIPALPEHPDDPCQHALDGMPV
jgi:hypothetical protein